VTLAHRGVLFLDELPEFRRNVLEPLRQPLEERRITVARGSGALVFPPAFQLVAAMNPCPCGWLGDAADSCRCTPPILDRYRARVSGPLLDRIDLHVEVPRVPVAALAEDDGGEESSARGPRARARRHARDSARGSESARPAQRAHSRRATSAVSAASARRAVGSRSGERAARALGARLHAHPPCRAHDRGPRRRGRRHDVAPRRGDPVPEPRPRAAREGGSRFA
jgi:predicted ATPase with chaperone activity